MCRISIWSKKSVLAGPHSFCFQGLALSYNQYASIYLLIICFYQSLTSVTSLYPNTQLHQCRTQLNSSHRRTKQSLVTTTDFEKDDSSTSERFSLSKLEENRIIFWWLVRVDSAAWHPSSWSCTSDMTGRFLSKSGADNHWFCGRKNNTCQVYL